MYPNGLTDEKLAIIGDFLERRIAPGWQDAKLLYDEVIAWRAAMPKVIEKLTDVRITEANAT